MKEFPGLYTLLLVCMCAASLPASSATMLAADNGMTLYVFDKDKNGVPTCYDNCAKQWPPYLAKGDQNKSEGWATVKRKDGSMQRTYRSRPVYFYADDKKPGDANGDGVGRIWHAVKE